MIGRNIARGCSVVLDPTGVSYDSDRGHLAPGPLGPSRVAAAGYQESMEAYYGGAGAALIMRRSSDGFDPDTWTTLRCLLPVGQQLGSILILRSAGTSGAPCT
jgi:hypothetical protein